jgi:hypothetical protein
MNTINYNTNINNNTNVNYTTKTLVDSSSILWTMEYDKSDNSVTLVSDYAVAGSCAIISQYSMDNALGHTIPEQVLSSAQDMIAQDGARRDPMDFIIDEYAGVTSSRTFA